MDLTIFLFALFALQVVCLYVGGKASKGMTTQDDYFLAGKSVSFFPLLMTLVATQIGGGLVMGTAEEAYKYGWSVIFYPLGQSLGFVVLAMGVGRRLAQFNVPTIAQIFEVVYRSPLLKQVASLLSMLSLFLIFAAQVIASKKFLVGIGFDQNLVFIGFWTIVIIYTVVGGMKAVIATDIIQALFFIVIFLAAICYYFLMNPVTVPEIINVDSGNSFGLGQSKLWGWLLLPMLFMIIEQDMAQRCFSARNGRLVSWASAGAALCTFTICLVPLFFGILAKTMGITVAEGSSVLMTVIQTATNPTVSALMGVAIIAAIISTADALINAVSSHLTQDFRFRLFAESNGVFYSRLATALIAIAGIVISFAFDNVVDLLILSYDVCVSCLFVPIFAALFNRKHANQLSAYLAIGFGAVAFLALRLFPTDFPREILGVGASLVGYFVGEGLSWMALFPSKELPKGAVGD